MKQILFLGLILIGLTAFGQQEARKADLKGEEQAIREISKNWLELEKKHDVTGMTELFADDGVLYRTNSEPAVGHDEIKKHFTRDHELNPKEEVDWNTESVEVAASGDMAVEHGKFKVKNSGKDGTETDEGRYVTVFRKVNGQWKVAADISTSTKPKDTSR